MDTGLDQRPGYPGCDIHAGVNLVSQTRVPTGKRGTGAGRALRWSRRALWSSTRPGANFIPVDGDRAVRPRSFSAYNGRSRPFGRRRVPVAMVRGGAGRTAGGDRLCRSGPAVPVIWGDTPSFVKSALRALAAGRPTVAGGRDPGYLAFLAMTFAFGGGLGTVVRLRQAAWAVIILVAPP